MKRVLFLFGLLAVLTLTLSSAGKKYIGFAILMPRNVYIPLYSENGKNIEDSVINDTIEEDYPLISISEVKDSLAKVKIYYPISSREQKGWIETRYLGTYLVESPKPMPIMSEPTFSSEVSFEIEDPQWGGFYRILDAKDEWLYIQDADNPEKCGWLAPEYQCCNPYTTCC